MTTATEEELDVLVVGAGLSGIGAACHLRRECPDRTFAILEARGAMGGTWDLFRYPGIRSDSDMYTLGYDFRPWTDPVSIADGPSILRYVEETAREYGVDRAIRYHHRVVRAEWSSREARWSVDVERADTGGTTTLTCRFLEVCSGYYRYDEGYAPRFPGQDEFTGALVHPQHWPEDLDWAGSRIVVIGSGATAVTLVPALAERAAHVTMLQRSPSWVTSLAARDPVAAAARRRLPPRAAYAVVRWKNILTSLGFYQLSRRRPAMARALLRSGVRRALPPGYAVDTHFAPRYDPWDQRLCLVPDGDLFTALRSGRAEVVTGTIETFTPTGVRLTTGEELAADVVVTATGLNLLAIGGMTLVVDGEEVELSKTLAYKGMMLSGVPNFSLTIGYTNASWTLKADLVARYVCRLLRHMQEHGYDVVEPVAPTGLDEADLVPLIDFSSGYVLRSIDALPKQGPSAPWRLHQNYLRDLRLMRHGPLDDGVCFRRAPAVAGTAHH